MNIIPDHRWVKPVFVLSNDTTFWLTSWSHPNPQCRGPEWSRGTACHWDVARRLLDLLSIIDASSETQLGQVMHWPRAIGSHTALPNPVCSSNYWTSGTSHTLGQVFDQLLFKTTNHSSLHAMMMMTTPLLMAAEVAPCSYTAHRRRLRSNASAAQRGDASSQRCRRIGRFNNLMAKKNYIDTKTTSLSYIFVLGEW